MTTVGGGASPRWRLACGWLTQFVVGTDLFVVSPLLPAIAAEYGLSAAQAGISVTAFSVTYLLCAPVIGHLADRFGRRRMLLGGLLGFALANLLTGLAPGFGLLLATRIAAGATAAGIAPLIYAGVGEAAPEASRATWMSIAVSGLLLALSLGAPAGTLLAAHWGWRAPFLVLALASLGLIAANRLVWPDDARRGGATAAALPALDRGAAAIGLLPTVLWATALYGAYTYLGVWLTGEGLSPPLIARAISFYGAGALVGTLIGGRIADRFGVRLTQTISLSGLAACLALFGIGVGTGLAADMLLLVLSVFAQLFFPAQQAGLVRGFPGRRVLLLALNNSALFLGISAGSVLGGKAMEWGGFSADAGLGALIAGLALVSIILPGRLRPGV